MNKTRRVQVNVAPQGRVHELNCVWLAGAFAAGNRMKQTGGPVPDFANYVTVRVDDPIVADHAHCTRCG